MRYLRAAGECSLLMVLSMVALGAPQTSKSEKPSADGKGQAMREGKVPSVPSGEKVDVLRQLSTSFEEISARSGRAVVQIFAHGYTAAEAASSTQNGELLTAENSSGSGMILSPDGYILTNSHVVKGAHTLRVQLNVRTAAEARAQGDRSAARPLPATVVGVDRESDLAVIKVEQRNLPFLEFGDSDAIKQGQLVLALGNPLGLDNSVSLGVVSAVARQLRVDDAMIYIQTDAPINPGNSGGPLIDADGRVVGVNTFILTQSGGSEGIGFSIPSSIARTVYAQLKAQGHVHRAQLGLSGQTINPDMADGLSLELQHGIVVSDLEPKGPAERGGVKVDDIIIALNGRRMDSVQQLEANVYRSMPGNKITLKVQRGADQLDLTVQTEEQSQELDALADLVDPVKNVVPQLGIVGVDISKPVIELMPDLRRPQGVVVAAHKPSAPYSGPALETGDVIYAVNRRVVNGVADLRQTLSTIKSGQPAVLQLEREGHIIYVALELD